MNTRLLHCAPFLLMLVSPATLAEVNVIFETGITQKHQKATIEEADGQKVSSADADSLVDNEFTALRLGFGGLYRDFFAVLHYDIPLNTRHEDNASSEQAQREDYDLTLGYTVGKGVSIYGGYKSGTTLVSKDALVRDDMNNITRISSESSKIREHGPFLGLTYSHVFGDMGALGLNLAYADMIGSNKIKKPDSKEKFDARVTGYSYGLKWTGYLEDAWSYFVDIRRNEYQMDLELDEATVSAPQEVKFIETYNLYSIGVSRIF